MLLPVLLLLPTLSTVSAQQCTASSDCPSPDAPYCSRWGWCQWTAQYGAAGPSEAEDTELPLGSCRSAQDCTPRAPVCSSQGFCTWQPSHQEAGSADTSRGNQISQTVSRQGSKGQAISRPRNNQKQSAVPANTWIIGRESRVQQQFIKSQTNHLDLSAERVLVTNNFKRSSGRANSNHRKNNQIKQKQSKRILAPVPAVPDQTTKSSRNPPQLFEPLIAVPVPGIQRRVPSTTTTAPPPPDNIDRVSTDYYEYYDYSYYADFEVMKQEEPAGVKAHTRGGSAPSNNQRGSSSRSQEKPRNQAHQAHQAHQATRASVSQGCLADCVTDCVAIEQLRAYRDCVEFCGRTCNDKK